MSNTIVSMAHKEGCDMGLRLKKTSGYDNIYEVDCFQQEFEDVLKEKNNNGRYHKWLRRELSILDELGRRSLQFRDFEYIENTNPKLYAIRYPKSINNPRVIFIFKEGNMVILLNTFKESSKNKYESAITIAENRLNNLEVLE